MKKLIFLSILLPVVTFAQHNIQGIFSPAESFSYALLYHVTPTATNFVKQVETKDDGTWSISLNEDAERGIYKIVYAVPVEENNFNVFYNGKENISLVYDLDNGLSFTASEENMIWENYKDSISTINGLINDYYTNKKKDKSKIIAIFETLKQTQNSFEEITSDKMISPFVKSNRVYIPDGYEDIKTYSLNLRKHYFDYMEFNHPLLQNSDFLNERVMAYVFAMPEESSYYKQAIDDVVKATTNNNDTKLILLQNLWDSMVKNELTEVAIYISDTYLLPLAKSHNRTYLVEAIENYNKSAIGKKALNFEFTYIENDKPVKTSLYNFNTKKPTLLIFWSSGCSHCLKELPKVKSIMDRHPEVTVLAYGLEDNLESWNMVIAKFPNFIHTYNINKWESPIIKEYGVSTTPSYFILDADKIIIAKPRGVEDINGFFKK